MRREVADNKRLSILERENKFLVKLIYLIENGIPIERELLKEYMKLFNRKQFNFMKLYDHNYKNKLINSLFQNPEMKFIARLIIDYSNLYSKSFLKIVNLMRQYLFEKSKTRILYENFAKKVKAKIMLTTIILYISGVFSLIYLFPLFKELSLSSIKSVDAIVAIFLLLGFTINFILSTYIIFESLEIKKQEFILFNILILGIFIVSLIKIFL